VYPWDLIDEDRIFLNKLCSTTHSQNFEQRCIGLSLKKTSPVEAILPIPLTAHFEVHGGPRSSGQLFTPGYYYLFLTSLAGAPSMGQIIQLIQVSARVDCPGESDDVSTGANYGQD
jgi:hypothetical protein